MRRSCFPSTQEALLGAHDEEGVLLLRAGAPRLGEPHAALVKPLARLHEMHPDPRKSMRLLVHGMQTEHQDPILYASS